MVVAIAALGCCSTRASGAAETSVGGVIDRTVATLEVAKSLAALRGPGDGSSRGEAPRTSSTVSARFRPVGASRVGSVRASSCGVRSSMCRSAM